MIAYISQSFPSLTTTFVYREVMELKRRGVPVSTFSIWRPDLGTLPPETRTVADETVNLFPISRPRLLEEHMRCAVGHPVRYLRLGAFLLTRRHERWVNIYKAWASAYAAREMTRRGVRHIHAHFASSPASVALVAARLTGASFSFTAHAVDIFAHRIMLIEKLREARFVIAISEYNKRVLAELVPEAADKIHVVHCGVDPRAFAPVTPQAGSGPPVVLAVGQMREKKGLPYLVEACRLLVERGVEFHCVIVGGGDGLDALRRQVSEAGLNGHLTLTGPLFQSEVRAHLRQAALFVLPCIVAADGDRDGIPVSLMEAMAMELSVVSTTVSGIPELIADGQEGFLVPPREPAALADVLARLLGDSALRRSLGRNGRLKVMAEFDLEKNVEQLVHIFEQYGVL
jgi:colanic acid/amylovoran biosynthesis glycosyltransferase